jgi:universal stress protein A
MRVKRILVPVDFSQGSLNALRWARNLARQFGAELLLLHVVAPIDFITVSDVYEEQRRSSDAALARIGADLRAADQRFRVMVEGGVPSHVIVETAKRAGADLIVMGTHGRTGVAHLLIGSVAEKVVRTAGCPVLAVRRTVRRKKAPKRKAR